MLTKADEYPIHQTPDPVAHAGTDRNFYDRFFFSGWSPDGQTYIAAALGLYPHLDIIDGAFAIAHGGVQTSVFASRVLHSERLNTYAGPIALEIIEPLKTLGLSIAPNEFGLTASLKFDALLPPVEEERHGLRHGPRTMFELTRMTQFGRYDGWAARDDVRIDLSNIRGVRDRSWGVRQIGARDPQPSAHPPITKVFWVWAPIEFEGVSLLFVEMDDHDGEPVKRRAELITQSGAEVLNDVVFEAWFDSETRRARAIRITGRSKKDGKVIIDAAPTWEFPLVAIGYSHPIWLHGSWHGPLAVHGETRILDQLDPLAPENRHVHAPAAATLRYEDGRTLEGRGIVEQIVVGSHPYEGLDA